MFNKVLILSASAGAGHIRAAQAIEKAILEMGAAREVLHVDTLEYTNKVFRSVYSKTYIDMVNHMPELLGWLYDFMDRPWKRQKRRLALDMLNTRPFVKLLQRAKADIAICTHFLPSEIISWLTAKGRISHPQAIVVTDMDVHAMWLCRHFQHYFVPLEETRVHLEKLGIPSDKVTVSGIPIDPVFAQPKDKREMRRKHGLDPDRTTILISAGGFGVGQVEHLIHSLLELHHSAQVVAICGKSEKLKAKLDDLASELPSGDRVGLRVVGYTKEMDELMSASDILVGKPGGLTTSEALAKGLVLCIVNPIPGQEERNSDHLLEEGVAIRCNNLPALAYKLDRLLDDPARLRKMQANVARMARPRAAYHVVEKLLELRAPAEEGAAEPTR
jgi:processive 1,2-diacylglycerol beta-glucosyltransferase